jgi:hypothetical protein
MPKEWTDDEVQKQISEAVQIVREDRIDALLRRRLSAPSANENGGKDNTPPISGSSDNSGKDSDGNPVAKKKSLWWGTEE